MLTVSIRMGSTRVEPGSALGSIGGEAGLHSPNSQSRFAIGDRTASYTALTIAGSGLPAFSI